MRLLETDQLGHYLRIHLIGASAGIELFGRGESFPDQQTRETLRAIRAELHDERSWLLRFADSLGHRRAPLVELAVKAGERVGRLKPNGHLTQRTPLTDVVDLEAMLTAVRGKRAGWESLLACADSLGAGTVDELRSLRDQADRQIDQLDALHAAAAHAAFAHRLTHD